MSKSKRQDHAQVSGGLVVASYGRQVIVEDQSGARHRCMIKGRKLRPVCGDRVDWRADDHGNVVTAIAARDNELARPDRRGRKEVLAANIDQLVVVVAAEPAADPFITDRYLAAARLMRADAMLVWNKTDLEGGEDRGWLDELTNLGYPLIETSCTLGSGIDELATACRGKISILVGQSGVGKSSLLNVLVPDLDARTQSLSPSSGEGKHTTSASSLHWLPDSGGLIDSPGVRDYVPAPIAEAEVADGYVEIAELKEHCRFHNCLHLREPDCAVVAAIEDGTLSARRYASYKRLINLMRQLPGRGPVS